MEYVFVYGTLMSDYIYNSTRNTEKLPASNATLKNYTRVCIRNKIYPAIIPQPASSVDGLLKKVPGKDLCALDEFEGDEYHRELLEVQAPDGKIIQAWTYVWAISHNELIMKEWDFNQFLLHQQKWQKENVSQVSVEIDTGIRH